MKKLLFVLLIVLLLTGCGKKEIVATANIEYGSNESLKELVSLEEGKVENDYYADTTSLGEKEVTIKYKNNDNNKEKEGIVIVNVVDTTKPIIKASKEYYKEVESVFDPSSLPMCFDNYDRDIKCEVQGTYDINTVGSYPLIFTSTDQSGNTTSKDFVLYITEKKDDEEEEYEPVVRTPFNDFVLNYKNDSTEVGIDVSEWQGDINWDEVKEAGVTFAFIRLGFGRQKDDKSHEMVLDDTFIYNFENAQRVGIKTGVYFYSDAKSKEEAIDEANFVLDNLKDKKLDLPIAFDWEEWNYFHEYRFNLFDINNVARSFLDKVSEGDYEGINYGSGYFLNYIWDIDEYPTWLAHYASETDYEKPFSVWQLSSTGSVLGIDGSVDINILYKK